MRRRVAITMGLAIAGAIVGATTGFVTVFIGIPFGRVPPDLTTHDVITAALSVAAMFGAPLGAVTAPSLGWLFLRRVPLGRMFLGSAVGTFAGGVVGWMSMGDGDGFIKALLSAFIGCSVAAVLLRYHARRLEA